ncbi:MAG: VOC family protein [Chloroflexi bacterium]|nr:VOC family protein [Chloroflexota bacterium]
MSLAVADVKTSREFYESLGFKAIDGQFNYEGEIDLEPGQDWVMLEHGGVKIGLFQGMFEDNVLTWNPADARAIQSRLKEKGVKIDFEATGFEGPATVMLTDPDGNQIMLDQF